MPKTILGKWSAWLALVFLGLIFIGPTLDATFYKSVTAGDTILEDLTLRPFLAIPMLLGVASAIAAFVTGLIAIIKHKERAILVYISTALGALLLVFVIGDLFSAE
ncbi:MAG: hypothetical protein HY420_04210 [Candidatus Kerfeldbacteria bacterium]|nr:hypothetical protein [Candidatus Kerfeldbacteria bacterium]